MTETIQSVQARQCRLRGERAGEAEFSPVRVCEVEAELAKGTGKVVVESWHDIAARNAELAAQQGIDPERQQREQRAAEDEAARRSVTERMAAAGVPPRYCHHRLGDFRRWLEPSDPDWSGGGYCLRGPTGNGKSSLAGALVRERMLAEPNLVVRWISILDFVERVKSAAHPQSRETGHAILKSLRSARLLVIDDLGKERGHDWDKGILTNLLWNAWDYEQDLIITTQFELEQLHAEHDALASRLGALREVALGREDLRNGG